jgi:tetratricopeptide (TPR) repeat protein
MVSRRHSKADPATNEKVMIMSKRSFILALNACAISVSLGLSAAQPALAVDDLNSTTAPDLTSVRAKIAAEDYPAALAELRDLAEDNQQADVYNLMGFALRKTGDYETSLVYYTKALELEPDHKAAHEYLGELYLETNDLAKAREQLAILGDLCPSGCEELDDLRTMISAKAGS